MSLTQRKRAQFGQLHTERKSLELFSGNFHTLIELKEIISVVELAIAKESHLTP
jgi:hypothetical protein